MSQDTTPRVSFVFLYLCEQSIEPFSLGSCFCNKPRIMVYLAVRVHPDCCTLKRREAKNLLGTPRGTICLAVHFDSSSIKWPLVIEVFYLEVVLPGLLTILDYLRPVWGLPVNSPLSTRALLLSISTHRHFPGSDSTSRRSFGADSSVGFFANP